MNCVKLFVLVLVLMKYDSLFVSGGGVRCIEREREALVKFKHALANDSGLLSSWGYEDEKKECCNWFGVHCSNTTGHVIDLLLSGYWNEQNDILVQLKGDISPSLLDLHHLKILNLRENDFMRKSIPSFIGSMKTLEFLDLSFSNISGSIPSELGNLTNLKALYLSWNHFESKIPHFIGSSKMLEHLDLGGCGFVGTVPPQLGNLTNLRTLDVSDNNGLRVENLNWLYRLSLLTSLDLSSSVVTDIYWDHQISKVHSLRNFRCSECQLRGSIPNTLGKLVFLEHLDLSHNMLEGVIPKTLVNSSHLKFLQLSSNSLQGIVSEADLEKTHNLKDLRLSFNQLTLNITSNWIPPFQLETISLACCKLGPSFPKWLQTQKNVHFVDFSCNNISDEVPHWLWDLSSMTYLNLSRNNIHGKIPSNLSSKFNFSGLTVVDISYNHFSGPMPVNISKFDCFLMSHNSVHGSISTICDTPGSVKMLDLSYNQLFGQLPNCWMNMTDLGVLNLANNQLFGKIPQSLISHNELRSLTLRNNNFSGELPSFVSKKQSLSVLDVGGNHIIGSIPASIGNLQQMIILSFRRNNLHGSIPPELCHLSGLQVLDLSRNYFSGRIPHCLNNLTSLKDSTTYPYQTTLSFLGIAFDFSSYDDIEEVLIQWKGMESKFDKTLGMLKLIDLSSNKLNGSIPMELYDLKGLISLNLSRNQLVGPISSYTGQMEELEVLDLSRNHLFGGIPANLSNLHYLSNLDLADNDLSGKIPQGHQLDTFGPSVYAGNIALCGYPLARCPGNNHAMGPTSSHGNAKDGYMMHFLKEFGLSIGLGFVVGFWGFLGSLLINIKWRNSYFNFLGNVGDWLYVTAVIFLRRLFRR